MKNPDYQAETPESLAFAQSFRQAQALMNAGHYGQAAEKLKACLKINFEDYQALTLLAKCYQYSSYFEVAKDLALKAINVEPDRPEAYETLGFACTSRLEYEEALTCFQMVAKLLPDQLTSYFNLGIAQRNLALFKECAESMAKCLELKPDQPEPMFYLGLCNRAIHNDIEAESNFSESIVLADKKSPKALLGLAEQFIQEGLFSHAEACADLLYKITHKRADALQLKGEIKQQEGQFGEAEDLLKRSLALQPNNPKAYFDICNGRKLATQDRTLLDSMKSMATKPGLNLEGKRYLAYGLAKAHDNLNDFSTAAKYYDEANLCSLLQLGPNPFDKKHHQEYVDSLIEEFSAKTIKALLKLGSTSQKPIFVVGMIRSGTTLCEQIVASHPMVGAAGEVLYLIHRPIDTVALVQKTDGHSELAEYCHTYLKLLESKVPGKERITDKYPLNFMKLGLIHAAFPRAKIIHMRRHPLDNCLSMYQTPFGPGVTYCYNQESIAFFYMEYLRLMAHWRKVIPAESMLEVQYEELVGSPESEIHRVVDFLGLPWDDAVLSHHKNSKHIQTPSQWQARQPIYNSSVGRYQKYKEFFPGFKELEEIPYP